MPTVTVTGWALTEAAGCHGDRHGASASDCRRRRPGHSAKDTRGRWARARLHTASLSGSVARVQLEIRAGLARGRRVGLAGLGA